MKNKLISLSFLFIQLLLSAIFIIIAVYVYENFTFLNLIGYTLILAGITGVKDMVKYQHTKFLIRKS